MLTPKMEKALNDQLNRELFSAYLYYSMAAYFDSTGFEGMANWMKVQSGEETFHATKFYNYINDRNGKVTFAPLQGPQTEWSSPLNAFEDALKHEQYISQNIYNLVDLAREEKDHMTDVFLAWFVTEQAEEEMSVSKVIDKMKMVKEAPGGLFFLDSELGRRTASPAPADSETA